MKLIVEHLTAKGGLLHQTRDDFISLNSQNPKPNQTDGKHNLILLNPR